MSKKLGRGIKTGIGSIPDRLDRKGRERLTIMFIPHGNDRVFTLHVNWHMIGFVAGSVVASVMLSFYGYFLHRDKAIEAEQQKQLYGINYTAAYSIEKQSTRLQQNQGRLRENLLKIARLTAFDSSALELLPSVATSRERGEDQLAREVMERLGANQKYLHSTYTLAGLNTATDEDLLLLASVRSAAVDGAGVYMRIPLGRPVQVGRNYRDTSDYGIRVDPVTGAQLEFHSGIDMAGARGTPVQATANGVVQTVMSWDPGYGNAVVLRHGNGFHSLYGHMDRVLVRPGQVVFPGTQIGLMGSTGRVTGVHLHYEVWTGQSKRTNPEPFMCAKDFQSYRCRNYHDND